jgi:hypothetical protein
MDKPAPKVKEPSMSRDNPDRQARLAEALRANLRRRKAQAREQDMPAADPRPDKAPEEEGR